MIDTTRLFLSVSMAIHSHQQNANAIPEDECHLGGSHVISSEEHEELGDTQLSTSDRNAWVACLEINLNIKCIFV